MTLVRVKDEDLLLNDDQYIDIKIKVMEGIYLEAIYEVNSEGEIISSKLGMSKSIYAIGTCGENRASSYEQQQKNQIFRLFPVAGKQGCFKIGNYFKEIWSYLWIETGDNTRLHLDIDERKLILSHYSSGGLSTKASVISGNNIYCAVILQLAKSNNNYRIFYEDGRRGFNKYLIFPFTKDKREEIYENFKYIKSTSTVLNNILDSELDFYTFENGSWSGLINFSLIQEFSIFRYDRQVNLKCEIYDLEFDTATDVTDAIQNDIEEAYFETIEYDGGVTPIYSKQWTKSKTSQCRLEFNESFGSSTSVHFKAGCNIICSTEIGIDTTTSHNISESNGYTISKTKEYSDKMEWLFDKEKPGKYKISVLFFGTKNGVRVPFTANVLYTGRYSDNDTPATKLDIRRALKSLYPKKDFSDFIDSSDTELIYKKINGMSNIKTVFRTESSCKPVIL